VLRTSHAYHSAVMDPAVHEFRKHFSGIALRPPELPFLSSVTGTWITAAQATDPAYWATHLRATVRFRDAAQELLRVPDSVLLEVGPGHTLGRLIRQNAAGATSPTVIESLPEPDDPSSPETAVLQALGQLWCEGLSIDWAGVHANEKRLRVPLPTYPFERRRFWFDSAAPPKSAPSRRADKNEWCYVPTWKQAPELQPFPELASLSSRRWLVFCDDLGIGARLAEQIRARGGTAIEVSTGGAFGRAGDAFRIEAGARRHYRELVDTLLAEGFVPDAVVHLWTVAPNGGGAIAPDAIAEARSRGFESLWHLAQSLGEVRSSPLPITVVTNNLFPVLGGDSWRPERSILLGPSRTISQEYKGLSCRVLDCDLGNSEPAYRIPPLLLQMVESGRWSDTVALRGSRCWVLDYERAAGRNLECRKIGFRDGGVYLISGGLGELGLELARHIAEKYKCRLVLLGRRGLAGLGPDRGKLLESIERTGSEVLVLQADVADREQVQQALGAVGRRFGAIHGLLHLAGSRGGGLIRTHDPHDFLPVLEPKVTGSIVLHEALAPWNPEFEVYFSSIFSATGGAGQTAYCAANAFLDVFAQHLSSRGIPACVSIDWDGWEANASQTELAERAPELREVLDTRRAEFSIRVPEGLEVLESVLRMGIPHVVVSTRDLHYAIAAFREAGPATASDAIAGSAACQPAGISEIEAVLRQL